MKRRQVLAGIGAGAVALSLGGCSTEAIAPEVSQAMAAGGHVLYFRHAATDRGGADLPDQPRAAQRNLSEDGIADCELIGRRFRELRYGVDEVRASPFFRCMEMGEIAFGQTIRDEMLLSSKNELSTNDARNAYLLDLMAQPRGGQGHVILIGHSGNFLNATGVLLEPGEAGVVRPKGPNGFEIVGQVLPEQW
jgi:phosphohistidine phosphatase SixA